MNKEEVYDEKIGHLMTEIIAVCKQHKIAMLAQFAIPIDSDPYLCCTTTLCMPEHDAPPHMVQASSFLKRGGRPSPMNMRIESPGKTTLVTIAG